MAPEALIPRPDTLQVGWAWFQILLTVTFVLHILFMNALLGGAFVSLLGGMRRSGAERDNIQPLQYQGNRLPIGAGRESRVTAIRRPARLRPLSSCPRLRDARSRQGGVRPWRPSCTTARPVVIESMRSAAPTAMAR